MVGNVGGTLGLFIGFSFTGLIAFALKSFLKMMEFIEKRSNKITEQGETSSGMLYVICENCVLHTLNCFSPSGYEDKMQETLYFRLIKLERTMKREFKTRDELMRQMEEKISKSESNSERF